MVAGGASPSRPYGILKACTCWPERLEPDLRSGDLETAFHRSERPSMVSAWLRCKETALKTFCLKLSPLRKDARIPGTSPLLLARCLDRNAGVLNPAGAHKKRSRHSTMASHIPCSVHPILALSCFDGFAGQRYANEQILIKRDMNGVAFTRNSLMHRSPSRQRQPQPKQVHPARPEKPLPSIGIGGPISMPMALVGNHESGAIQSA
jgi:hypothetical protein